jgi:hypothetical protein
MSEERRRQARDRALDARNGLAALIKHAGVPDKYRDQMQESLVMLWNEASIAMGDLGEPVFPSLMTKVRDEA